MPANLYTDAEASAPQEPTAPTEPEAAPEEETAADEATAELPDAVFGGKEFKPGEEVVLEVVQKTETGYVVKYASEKGGEGYGGEEEYPPAAAPAPANAMSPMME